MKTSLRLWFSGLVVLLLGASGIWNAVQASASSTPSNSQVKKLVGSFISQFDALYGSPAAQWKFLYGHTYPGFFDEASYMSCAANSSNNTYSEELSMNFSEMTYLSNYHFPTASFFSGDPKPLLAGQAVKGSAFLIGNSLSDSNGNTSTSPAHFFILTGKVYVWWAPSPCAQTSPATPLHVVSTGQGSSQGGVSADYTAAKAVKAQFTVTSSNHSSILINVSTNCQNANGTNSSTNYNLNLSLPVTNRAITLPKNDASCMVWIIANPNQGQTVHVSLSMSTN